MAKLTYIKFYSKAKNLDKYVAVEYGLPVGTPKILSNFHIVEGGLCFEGLMFDSVEHAFQHQKFLCVKDDSKFAAELIAPDFIRGGIYSEDAKAAKSAGTAGSFRKKKITLNIDLWNERSKPLMEALIDARIKQDKVFRSCLEVCWDRDIKLYHHGRSSKDIWCCHVKNDGATGDEYLEGMNQLGTIMMDAKLRFIE